MTADTVTSNQEVSISVGNDADHPTKSVESDTHYSRRSRKEALMELIAQEMVSSLLGKDDDIEEDGEGDESAVLKEFQKKLAKREAARRKARRRSSVTSRKKKGKKDASSSNQVDLANMYYAQMTGDVIPEAELKEYELKVKDDDDNDSFAGGCLDDLVGPSHRSTSSRSRGSKTNSTSNSTSSHSSGSTSADSGMDVEEIRKFVLSNIPQAVRDQIPESAWGEIFQGSAEGGSNSKGSARRSAGTKSKGSKDWSQDTPVQDVVVDKIPTVKDCDEQDDDDLSVLSEITGLTTAFPDGRRVESKLERMASLAGGELPDENTATKLAPEAPGEGSCSITERESNLSILNAPSSSHQHISVKKVQFSHVTVRHYERILTDNPAVQSGPAIGIGWRYKRGLHFDVEEFEQGRGFPRSSDELVLSRATREQMLKDAGFTQKEIADIVRSIVKTKNQRKQTINNLSAQGVEEAVEGAKRRVARLLSFGRSSDILI